SSVCNFFAQAEDGIRDRNVAGVQTCALPIYASISARPAFTCGSSSPRGAPNALTTTSKSFKSSEVISYISFSKIFILLLDNFEEIGRASCRKRVVLTVVSAALKRTERL